MNWIISHLPNQATIGILAGGLSVHLVMSLRNLKTQVTKLESKIDKLETNLEQDIKGVETKLESKIDKLESKVDRKLEQVNIRLDDIYKLLLGQNRENKTSTTPKHIEKTTTLAT